MSISAPHFPNTPYSSLQDCQWYMFLARPYHLTHTPFLFSWPASNSIIISISIWLLIKERQPSQIPKKLTVQTLLHLLHSFLSAGLVSYLVKLLLWLLLLYLNSHSLLFTLVHSIQLCHFCFPLIVNSSLQYKQQT